MRSPFSCCLKTILLMLIVGAAGPVEAGINLVSNGNFGSGDFSSWTLSGDDGQEAGGFDSYVLPDGQGNNVAALGTTTTDGFLTQNLATTQGLQYTVSFILSSDGTTPNSFMASLGGTTLVTLADVPGPSSSYTSYSFTYTEAGPVPALLSFDFNDTQGFLFLTNVSVVANSGIVPEPMSIIGVGMGFVMTMGYGWRKSRRRSRIQSTG